VLILTAILNKRKTKSAQYRFLFMHRQKLKRLLSLDRFPARSTYFQRYPQADRLLEPAIVLQGQRALEERVTTACSVAVDKSLLWARGTPWHGKRRCKGKVPPELQGVDRQADWGFSPYHKWVYGYSYEVVTTADSGTINLPLVASGGLASASEHTSCPAKIEHLPSRTSFVLADSGYDSNALGDRVERDDKGRSTGRRFVCPPNRRNVRGRPSGTSHMSRSQRLEQQRRWARIDFYQSPRGHRLYARRSQSVEPLHERLKSLFELNPRVWHRGLANNRTQLLATVFCYQLLLRYNHLCGRRNAQVQWIIECL